MFIVNGVFTLYIRKKLGLKKDREENFDHYAIDAAIVGYASSADIIKQLSKSDLAENPKISSDKNYIKELDTNIFKIKTQIQCTKPKISHRVIKRTTEKLFNETIYSTRKVGDIEYVVTSLNIMAKIDKDSAKKLDKIFDENNSKVVALMQEHDEKIFKNLKEIYDKYKDVKKIIDQNGKENKVAKLSPFKIYYLETRELHRNYAKKVMD
ncbi:MAG: hypothetical protein ACK5NF_02660 [Bacilli bacterium]